ncbi:flagellar hook protein FlgE [Sulfurihydrogenibium yellowstonense]|uniref:Flagellar hook protein FlgE n=1 Tax=Sulfurihydrogenibium yellowstonense SS-5 TaxID=432331 RepID=C4FHL9_9AQUI|nr:flagellar hook protein FlgE [Sulfurihydrogenibium yellowstonense]EEP61412.1 flagellar basal body and hook protein FlgE [Sulfurihydrogenibium yellowstonense SS-5]
MLQSFYTAITGLNGNQQWLNVISDNIANVNTIGFKSERVTFEDLIAHSLTTFANNTPKNTEIGGGSFIALTTKDFSQGSFMNTNSPTDLALDGEGFFMVKDNQGTVYYTRAGQFRLNADGDLVNVDGMKLQGWTLDDKGNIIGALDKINVPYAINPTITTKISLVEPTNLDSRSNVISATFDPTDSTTFNYVNSMTVYDSLGNPHTLSFYFQKTNESSTGSTWKVYVYMDNDLTTQVGSSTLNFDTNGNLTSGSPFTLSLTLTNGATSPQSITVDVSKIKQVASDFIFYANQDGFAKGDLIGVAVAEDGIIKGMYSNGNVKNIARLAVATFKDKEMLVRKGNNLYLPNTQTFTPIITPGGILSKVRSGFLELSNVDISREFINLITAQRAYQANARVITTDDQILQEAMNIKR